jgi:hypothetical protein
MPTITLHWHDVAGPRQANVVCEDGSPQALLPLLVAGCGLPTHAADGYALRYLLRTDRPGRPALNPARLLSEQRILDGARLWLAVADQATMAGSPEPTRCLLALPEGRGEVVVPSAGLILDRGWLLRALELLDPSAYARETELLSRRRSPLIYVSGRPHCRIGHGAAGGWFIQTERDDVVTRLNDAVLPVGAQRPLTDGDRLRLGDAGPLLTITTL